MRHYEIALIFRMIRDFLRTGSPKKEKNYQSESVSHYPVVAAFGSAVDFCEFMYKNYHKRIGKPQ